MEKNRKQIAESLRLCSDAPLKCRQCVEVFGIGCASRLRTKAADTIEEMAVELEKTRQEMNTISKKYHCGRNNGNGMEMYESE